MKIKQIILAAFLSFTMVSTSWAQNHTPQQTYQVIVSSFPNFLSIIQMRAQVAGNGYAMAQQMGDTARMQMWQAQGQMHQNMYNAVSALAQNPAPLQNPQVQMQFMSGMSEYNYRSDSLDMRPYDQIQAELAKYIAYSNWKGGTPEGRQSAQDANAQIQANTRQNTINHGMRMNDINQASAAQYQTYQQNQATNDISHQQNIHAINNEYQYVDPNTNRGYWVPMENTNPSVVNPDGSSTQLEPYHNY